MKKKAMSSIISILLLLLLGMTAAMTAHSWFSSYYSGLTSDAESLDVGKNDIAIESVKNKVLYVMNSKSSNISIDQIRIEKSDCIPSKMDLEPGLNEINLTDCISSNNKRIAEVVIETDKGLYSESLFLDDSSMPGPSITFAVNNSLVDYGGDVLLSWSSSKAESCVASGDWSGDKSLSGSETLTGLVENMTYSLVCTGELGVATASVDVHVAEPSDCMGPDSSVILHGSSKTYYLAYSVSYDESCSAQTRTCLNGNLNGSYTNPSCSVEYCPFGTVMGLCSICDGLGVDTTQAATDDASCGTIDCDGLDNYYITGTQGATSTSYCYLRNYADITSNRCEGLGDCKDANSADCSSYSDSKQNTAGICKYISGCSGSAPGSVSNYAAGTDTGLCRECDGLGTERASSDDNACGIIDCDSKDYYYMSGDNIPYDGTKCYYRDYVDITTNRCEGIGNCKEQDDCTYTDILEYDLYLWCLEMVGCSGNTPPSVVYAPVGTPCYGGGGTCNAEHNCEVPI